MTLNDKIKAIDDKYNIILDSNLTFWSYIKLKIYVKFNKVKQGDRTLSPLIFAKEIFRSFLSIMKGLLRRNDIIFFTSANYRTVEDKIYYDRFCDPIADIYEKIGLSIGIFESGSNSKYFTNIYKPNRVFRYYEFVILISKLLYKFSLKKNTSLLDEQLNPVIGEINEYFKDEQKSLKLDVSKLREDYNRLMYSTNLIRWWLKILRPKLIFVVCYYSERGLPITIAANQLKIPIIDIQHGIQGESHFAYNGLIDQSLILTPKAYWLWDGHAEKEFHYLSEHPWLYFWSNNFTVSNQKSPKVKRILYTLQPLDNSYLITKDLMDLIKMTKDYHWVFRFHPQQNQDLTILKEMFDDEINECITFESGAESLFNSLKQTDIHITNWSSVASEASFFNIPTLFIHKDAGKHFNILANDLYFYSENIFAGWNDILDFSSNPEHIQRDGLKVVAKKILDLVEKL